MVITIRELKRQMDARLKEKGDAALKASLDKFREKLTAVEEEVYQVRNRSGQDPLNFPIKLNNKLAALEGTVESSDDPPTTQTTEVYEGLASQVNVQLETLKKLVSADLAAFNRLVHDQNVPAVIVAEPKPAETGAR